MTLPTLLLLSGLAARPAVPHRESGVLGDYEASREASGTSWQPDAAGWKAGISGPEPGR